MIPEQRRDFIYRYVHEKNAASFNELADLMSVSHMTVRRDIQLLEEEGKVIAINGGSDPTEAMTTSIAVAVPLSVAGLFLTMVCRTIATAMVHGMDKCAENDDMAGIERWQNHEQPIQRQ